MAKNYDLVLLGSALRGRREQMGISQEELAARSGLHRTYVGSVERGERNISFMTLKRYIEGLGLDWIALGRLLSNPEGNSGNSG